MPHIEIRGIAQNPVRVNRRVNLRDLVISAECEFVSVFLRGLKKRLRHFLQLGERFCRAPALRSVFLLRIVQMRKVDQNQRFFFGGKAAYGLDSRFGDPFGRLDRRERTPVVHQIEFEPGDFADFVIQIRRARKKFLNHSPVMLVYRRGTQKDIGVRAGALLKTDLRHFAAAPPEILPDARTAEKGGRLFPEERLLQRTVEITACDHAVRIGKRGCSEGRLNGAGEGGKKRFRAFGRKLFPECRLSAGLEKRVSRTGSQNNCQLHFLRNPAVTPEARETAVLPVRAISTIL